MNLQEGIANAILRMQDPTIIARVAAEDVSHPIMSARIRRALEKAAAYPQVQEHLAAFIETWAEIAAREY